MLQQELRASMTHDYKFGRGKMVGLSFVYTNSAEDLKKKVVLRCDVCVGFT